MSSTYNSKGSSTVKEHGIGVYCYILAAGVDDIYIFFARLRCRSHAHNTVLGLKHNGDPFRKVIRYHSRKADSEIYDVTVFQFPRNSSCDNFL